MIDTVGKRIKAAREALGLSQYDLGGRLGVNQSTVALWEKDRTTPRNDKLDEISRILLLTKEYIMFGSSGIPDGAVSVPVTGYVGSSDIIHSFPLKEPQMLPAPPAIPGRVDTATHAVIVLGNDLWPVYRDGDILFFSGANPLTPQQAAGHECIVELDSGEKVLKRIVQGGANGTVILSSFQGPELIGINIKKCTPVVWVLRASPFRFISKQGDRG